MKIYKVISKSRIVNEFLKNEFKDDIKNDNDINRFMEGLNNRKINSDLLDEEYLLLKQNEFYLSIYEDNILPNYFSHKKKIVINDIDNITIDKSKRLRKKVKPIMDKNSIKIKLVKVKDSQNYYIKWNNKYLCYENKRIYFGEISCPSSWKLCFGEDSDIRFNINFNIECVGKNKYLTWNKNYNIFTLEKSITPFSTFKLVSAIDDYDINFEVVEKNENNNIKYYNYDIESMGGYILILAIVLLFIFILFILLIRYKNKRSKKKKKNRHEENEKNTEKDEANILFEELANLYY